MNRMSRLVRRLRALVDRRRSDAEFADELAFHTEMEAAELQRGGVPAADAAREARRRLGGVDRYTEELRDVRGARRTESIVRDLRHGFRVAVRTPGFSIIVVLTLGLTIGANTALFSVVNASLLRPLPFPRDHELVSLTAQNPDGSAPRFSVSYADFVDWRRDTRTFADMAIYGASTFTLAGGDGGEPERISGVVASSNFFDVLEVRPALGQLFGVADADGVSSESVVISHGLWTRRFGADSAIIGTRVEFTGSARTIIGVLPAAFRPGDRVADAYVVLNPAGIPGGADNHGQHLFQAVGRLKPGVTRAAAQQDLRTVAERLGTEHADIAGWTANVWGLRDEVVRDVRNPLYVLLAASGCVLLIGCINVANLFIVRGASRSREISLRRALGASRARLVGQLLIEGGILASAGGVLGVVIAAAGTPVLIRIIPAGLIPRLDQTSLDARVLGFAAALSLLTTIGVALWPALRATRSDLARTLRDGGRGTAGGSPASRVRRTLVVAEVSLALVLLVCSSLVLRSLYELLRVDPGFRADRVLTMRVTLGSARYDDPARVAFFSDLLTRLEARSGIEAAAAANTPPIAGSGIVTRLYLLGHPSGPQERPATAVTAVTPGYFRALGIRLKSGRDMEWSDRPVTMLASESAARELWPGEDPIGKRVTFTLSDTRGLEVVGVVSDVRSRGLATEAPAMMYLAYEGAVNILPTLSLVVRSSGSQQSTLATVKDVLREMDPSLPVYDVRAVADLVGESTAQPRLNTSLLTAFAVIAMLLAAIGIYGVVSFGVSQRAQEIGVRMALGARTADVVALVLREGAVLAAVGAVLGIGTAYALTPVVRRWIYGVGVIDAGTIATTAAAVVTVALIACWVPARRAGRVDPVTAIRAE